MCFVFVSEQTATTTPYNINWLVFITEMKSVYCAVRTGALNKTVYASSLKGSSGIWRCVIWLTATQVIGESAEEIKHYDER